ncbi:MAG TPA: alpha/beta hydrolase [Allosphingosinicella sp.]|nr:alpha/beta hydrolase [Allosphingosinicella sp.]
MTPAPFDRRAHPQGMRLWDWRAPDGWLHRRMDWLAEGGEARGSLLFAGGRGDFVEKYLEALAHWRRRGWSVSSFDWRGQGKSKGTIVGGHLDSFDILLEDLAALVEDWRAGGPGPHVIVGHSMGGHMLLRLLIERPPPIAAAVLTAPMIEVNSGPIPPRAARLIAAAASRIGFAQRALWGAPLARAPAGSKRQQVLTNCLERYEDELSWWEREGEFAPSPPTFGWLHASYRSGRLFTRRRLARVDLPILLVGVEQDRLVSADAIRRVAAALPRAELAMFDDCAHEILRERDGPRLAAFARINGFLERHAA